MISGVVRDRHALVPILVRGAGGLEREVEFVLDTGFMGYLTLPPAAVTALALPFAHRMPISLADGSWTIVEVYKATVGWDDEEQEVEVLAMGSEALLGTSLLDGHDVSVQFTDEGLVTIELL